jgi:ABC-type lipoprotein release transport system permease subunit
VGKTVHIRTQNNYRGEGAVLPARSADASVVAAFMKKATYLDATVVGVTGPSVNDNAIYIPLRWARGVTSLQTRTVTGISTTDTLDKNGYTNAIVQASSGSTVRQVSKRIEAMGYGTSSKQEQIDQVNQLSIVMWTVLGSISLISMLSASLGIVNTMLMTVSEQRYAIAVWRTCGATRSLISRLFLLQAFMLGLVGGLLGTTMGRFVSVYVNHKIVTLLHAQGLTSIRIDPASTASLVGAVVLTTLLAVAAGLYPAHRAARHIAI